MYVCTKSGHTEGDTASRIDKGGRTSSTKAIFFSYLSKPHIQFRSDFQVHYEGKILRGQWLSLRTRVYQDSQHEHNVAGLKISWEAVKGKKAIELHFQCRVRLGYNVINEFCVVINE